MLGMLLKKRCYLSLILTLTSGHHWFVKSTLSLIAIYLTPNLTRWQVMTVRDTNVPSLAPLTELPLKSNIEHTFGKPWRNSMYIQTVEI